MRSPFAYELDLGTERTFHVRRKKQRLGKRHKAQEESLKMDVGVGGQKKDIPGFQNSRSSRHFIKHCSTDCGGE